MLILTLTAVVAVGTAILCYFCMLYWHRKACHWRAMYDNTYSAMRLAPLVYRVIYNDSNVYTYTLQNLLNDGWRIKSNEHNVTVLCHVQDDTHTPETVKKFKKNENTPANT